MIHGRSGQLSVSTSWRSVMAVSPVRAARCQRRAIATSGLASPPFQGRREIGPPNVRNGWKADARMRARSAPRWIAFFCGIFRVYPNSERVEILSTSRHSRLSRRELGVGCRSRSWLSRAISSGQRCKVSLSPVRARTNAQAKLCRKEKEMPLQRTRKYTSAFLAITMLASSAASAAPAPNRIDPLVALSMLGTAGSAAAVCGPGSGVALCPGGSMAAASAGSAVAAEAGATEAYAAQDDGTTARGSMMPLWVALGAVFAGWLWTSSG